LKTVKIETLRRWRAPSDSERYKVYIQIQCSQEELATISQGIFKLKEGAPNV